MEVTVAKGTDCTPLGMTLCTGDGGKSQPNTKQAKQKVAKQAKCGISNCSDGNACSNFCPNVDSCVRGHVDGGH